ncbi:MAG: hypothetical protein P8Z71_03845 [Candidatus Sulfobium sp.]
MGWTCPECGFMNAENAVICTCGFDQSVFLSSDSVEAEPENGGGSGNHLFETALPAGDILPAGHSGPSSAEKAVAEKPRTRPSSFHPSDRIMLKEVGHWKVSFSPSERRISIGTAALEPFRLDLTPEDFEEILESVCEITGTRKTLRSLELMDKDVLELIEFVTEMIEAKKSRIRPSFSPQDVDAITALVNSKLSQ